MSVTVSAVPWARFLLVPDGVKPAACSLALITLSPAVVASVTLVSAVETVTVILPAEVDLLPSICTTDQVCSPSAWVGSVTVSAVLRDHGAGDGAAAAVFNLNGRARLPGTAEGWGVVIRDLFCTQHALLVTRVVRQQKCRRGAFDFFCIINNPGFGFAIAAVSQQCADRTALTPHRQSSPTAHRLRRFLLQERFNAANGCSLGG